MGHYRSQQSKTEGRRDIRTSINQHQILSYTKWQKKWRRILIPENLDRLNSKFDKYLNPDSQSKFANYSRKHNANQTCIRCDNRRGFGRFLQRDNLARRL